MSTDRNREADRARFTDPGFNRWMDEGISDAGHTVWDMVGDTQAAWAGWSARESYSASEQGITESMDRAWRACRIQVFALTEDTINRHPAEPNDFERGRYYEAKSIAKAMNAISPSDCDELAKVAPAGGSMHSGADRHEPDKTNPAPLPIPLQGDDEELMRQALYALEANHQWHQDYDDHDGYPGSELETQNVAAIAALRARLQPKGKDGQG